MSASPDPRIVAAHHVGRGGAVESSGTMGPRTRFPIGSVTKTVVALVAARLASHGVVAFDEPVGAGSGGSPITLRRLLLHQARLPFEHSAEHWTGPELTAAELAATLDHPAQVPLPPGTWHYSNLGYAVAASVLERQTGASFDQLARQWLLDPLDMRDTSYPDPDLEGPTPLGPVGAPAGGLWSTAADLATLGAALDQERPDVVGERELDLVLADGAPLPDGTVWCAGVRVVPVGDHRVLFASGTMSGRTTGLVVWPRRGVSVLVAERGVPHESLRDTGVARWRRPEVIRTWWWDGQEVVEARAGDAVDLLLRETRWPYPLFSGRDEGGALRGLGDRGAAMSLAARTDVVSGAGIRLTITVDASAFGQQP